MGAKMGRPSLPEGQRRHEVAVNLTVRLLPHEYEAFKAACDGRPMSLVLRGLAADFVAKVGGGA